MFPLSDLPFAFYACAALAGGLLIGSFLNVVIYRVPRGESVAFPGSHCGSCGAAVKAYDNIPLLSYALLRGRCRRCRAAISWVYPAVELLTGLLFLAVVFKSGATWRAVAEMAFVAVMVALVFIDARHKLLPDAITYPSLLAALLASAALGWAGAPVVGRAVFPDDSMRWMALGVGALLIAAAVPLFWLVDRMDDVLFGKYFEWEEEGATPEETAAEKAAERRHDRMVRATMLAGLIAAAVWAGLVFLKWQDLPARVGTAVAYERLLGACLGALVGGAAYFYTRGVEGMGLGDVKMMAVIGAFLGWQSSILVLIVGTLLGSVVGLALASRSAQGFKTAIPFGVFLGLAAVGALFFGAPLIAWYVGQFR
jgi:leader peptidase (prepilin peptidase) / N-methyltransferase